jgi:hypothetical protein
MEAFLLQSHMATWMLSSTEAAMQPTTKYGMKVKAFYRRRRGRGRVRSVMEEEQRVEWK